VKRWYVFNVRLTMRTEGFRHTSSSLLPNISANDRWIKCTVSPRTYVIRWEPLRSAYSFVFHLVSFNLFKPGSNYIVSPAVTSRHSELWRISYHNLCVPNGAHDELLLLNTTSITDCCYNGYLFCSLESANWDFRRVRKIAKSDY